MRARPVQKFMSVPAAVLAPPSRPLRRHGLYRQVRLPRSALHIPPEMAKFILAPPHCQSDCASVQQMAFPTISL